MAFSGDYTVVCTKAASSVWGLHCPKGGPVGLNCPSLGVVVKAGLSLLQSCYSILLLDRLFFHGTKRHDII